MDPITLGALGALALLALKGKQGEGAPKEEKQGPASSSPEEGGINLLPGAAALPAAAAATIAAGVAASFAAGKFGSALTGDKGVGLYETLAGSKEPLSLAAVTGELNIGYGTAINVGRVAGRELDQALGGPGTGGTGIVAQAGGGLVAFSGALLGAAAAASMLIFSSLAYLVGSIVSDLNRLAYGQKGAQADYDKEWTRVYGAVVGAATGKGVPPAAARRFAWPFADGYMQQKNRLAFRQWMRRGRGLLGLGTTDNAYHAEFGMDRGYFVGKVASDTLVNEPSDKSLTPEYYQQAEVPAAELTTTTVQALKGYQPTYRPNAPAFEKFSGSNFCTFKRDAGATPSADAQYAASCFNLVDVPIYGPETRMGDAKRLIYGRMGEAIGNADSFLQWMAIEPHGAFVNDEGHAKAGLEQGRFIGAATAGGRVKMLSFTVDELGTVAFAESELDYKVLLAKAQEAAGATS